MAEQLCLALKQCTGPKFRFLTKAIHSNFLKFGRISLLHLTTRLLHAYFKCKDANDARQLFDEIELLYKHQIDLVCWNSVISGCVQNDRDYEAFQYFNKMQYYYYTHYSNCKFYHLLHPLSPADSYTISSLLSSTYCLSSNIFLGELLHSYAFKTGIQSSLSVGNALITLYARWGRLQESRLLFDFMPKLSVVSWTALISGYAQWDHEEESFRMFVDMIRENDPRPNHFTFASIFSSCGKLASLSQGIPLITVALKMGLLSNLEVQNSLIGLYSECGYFEEAKATFKATLNPDLISWNSLLKGYSHQGNSEEALNVFKDMQIKGEKPDAITFLSLISACRHSGMISLGLELFRSMKEDYNIHPQAEHISCIVDLLGRAGQLHQAKEVIKEFPFELSSSTWRTLLGACRVHGQAELGEIVASRLLEMEPCDKEVHLVLSHIYAAHGRWDMVAKLRCSMKEKGLGKEPGCSWIEMGNKVHSFVATDSGHPHINDIQITLTELTSNIKEWTMEVLLD